MIPRQRWGFATTVAEQVGWVSETGFVYCIWKKWKQKSRWQEKLRVLKLKLVERRGGDKEGGIPPKEIRDVFSLERGDAAEYDPDRDR